MAPSLPFHSIAETLHIVHVSPFRTVGNNANLLPPFPPSFFSRLARAGGRRVVGRASTPLRLPSSPLSFLPSFLSVDRKSRSFCLRSIHAVSFVRDTVKLRLEASREASPITCFVNVFLLRESRIMDTACSRRPRGWSLGARMCARALLVCSVYLSVPSPVWKQPP